MAAISKTVRDQARKLRDAPTDAEKVLWSRLRRGQINGCHFRRQHPVPPYVVDFACAGARLAIEADGGQHAESATDKRRTAYLQSRGWRVLRFWNNDILRNTDGVVATIMATLDPHPNPPPLRGGGRLRRDCAAAPANGGTNEIE
ncbi:MAG: endonuclease domain-containing protein [Dongiaceae bacterium]